MVKETEQQKEQKHLDKVLGLIKKKESELDHSIEHAQNEAQNINSHFFDDMKLDYDGYCLVNSSAATNVSRTSKCLATFC